MINLAVINLKDVINFFKKMVIGIILLIIILKLVGNIKKGNYVDIKELRTKSFYNYSKVIDKTFLISNYYNTGNDSNESNIKKLLASELTILGSEEELMEKENQEEIIEFSNTNVEENITENNIQIQENSKEPNTNEVNIDIASQLPTKIIDENNKVDKYTDVYKSVKIKNESKYPLTEEMLTPNIDFSNKKDIVIYHTHTCESYTPTEANKYVASGNFRTTDLNYSVARVGTELSNYLMNMGFNIKHDLTYHDYPAYTGSYTRSLSTIKNILTTNNSEFVIDLHRDALGSNSNYGPKVQIGEEIAAQLMFVMRNRWWRIRTF